MDKPIKENEKLRTDIQASKEELATFEACNWQIARWRGLIVSTFTWAKKVC